MSISTYIKADVKNDIMDLFYMYCPEGIEYHKKEGIDIILIYDCINDSVIENYNLDNIGVYSLRLGNESCGIEFILLKDHKNYEVFLNIEPNRTQILREILRKSKEDPFTFNPTAMNNIMNNIMNPIGTRLDKRILPPPIDSIGELKLYFQLDTIRNKSLLSRNNENTNNKQKQ